MKNTKHKIMCSDDLRTSSAMQALKANIQYVPIEELEKFVEQFKVLTALS